MALKYSNLGEQFNLELAQGKTLFLAFEMVNADDSPYDLTGCDIRGQIRKLALDTAVVADLVVTITDDVNGEYTVELTDETVAAIFAGESIKDEESIYQWELELELSDGTVRQLYYGKINLLREVTRA